MARPDVLLLDPALPDELYEALEALVREGAPYGCYVEGPVREGFGVGLVRRHDALLHDMRRKMAAGEVESMEAASARANLFRGVFAEEGAVHAPEAASILGWSGFAEAARAISGLPVIEPTMLYVNLLLPGQELMVHTDTPEFVGLSKASVPEWLLVVMHHSGLFESHRIRIAGGVTFLNACEGGAFRYWPGAGDEARLHPRPNLAIKLDADVTFHGVTRVGGPDAPPPPARPGMQMRPDGDGWLLVHDGAVVARYGPGEVRVSVQWKARCFPDEAARAEAAAAPLTVDAAIATLEADLRARGVLTGPRPDDATLAIAMMDTYVPFPPA